MPARILRWTLCIMLAVGGAACGGGDDGGAGGASDGASSAAAPSAAATTAGAGAASESAGDDGGDGSGGGDRSGGGTYTVRSGDTLSSIAQELGTTVEALVEANDIADPDVIDIGQQLTVPSG